MQVTMTWRSKSMPSDRTRRRAPARRFM
jgi:hypothetical protein